METLKNPIWFPYNAHKRVLISNYLWNIIRQIRAIHTTLNTLNKYDIGTDEYTKSHTFTVLLHINIEKSIFMYSMYVMLKKTSSSSILGVELGFVCYTEHEMCEENLTHWYSWCFIDRKHNSAISLSAGRIKYI